MRKKSQFQSDAKYKELGSVRKRLVYETSKEVNWMVRVTAVQSIQILNDNVIHLKFI